MFIVSLFLIIAAIFVSSLFVWNVEIIGDIDIPKEELIESLRLSGLDVGKYKNNLNTKEIINRIRLERDDISWIGININGTNAIVEIVEAKKEPEIVNVNEYCNIIANKTGIITKIVAKNGTAMVKKGDTIEIGTLLVSGFIENKYTETTFVHAEAQIEAKVWYSDREKVYLNQKLSTRTGTEENRYSININNFKINLYKTVTKFEMCDTIQKEDRVRLFKNFYLPISITKVKNYELKEENKLYTLEEAGKIGEEILAKRIEEQIEYKENIVNTEVNYFENEGYIEVELIYEVLEPIGEKQKI